MTPLSREQMAARLARAIPAGSFINLGIGLPTLVARHVPADRGVTLHSENGILGFGGPPAAGAEDMDLTDAGKQPVTMLEGGCYMDSALSFVIMRGGHLDIAVLGAFQVAANGDLANWHTGAPDSIPAVGGAMDLAVGAKRVFVMMELTTKTGESKLVKFLSYPVTGLGCVTRIYTEVAIFDIDTETGLSVIELFGDATLASLRELTGLPLHDATVPPPAASSAGAGFAE